MRVSRPQVVGWAILYVLVASCTHQSLLGGNKTVEVGEYQEVLNGVRLYYRVAGAEGPAWQAPVLFLHGGPGYNSYSFARLMGTRLEKGRRMVYLDQRGCGQSERPWDGNYSLEAQLGDLEALRRELGVERWVLMGHSVGATLALEYATRYPERVAGVVYVSGLSDAPASFASWKKELERLHPGRLSATELPGEQSDYARVMRALRGLDAQSFFNQLQFHDVVYQQQQEAVDEESGLRNTGELSRALFSTELPAYRFAAAERVHTPVLVIAGRHDGSIGVDTLSALARKLPTATYLEYERSAHYPYLEEADRFEKDVSGFLSSLP
ncbi:alpha/beta fold hydrolase [Melittangium boletus]|uniref:alpha/beta fold hydrolase n=1 Tax=Melittangium boletus TaxID=83453 RepID=UPI003DA3522A